MTSFGQRPGARVVSLADERERRRGDTRLAELEQLRPTAGDRLGWPALESELTEVPHLHAVGEPDDTSEQLGLFDGGS
jgi:hypothetical protein